MWSFKIFLSFHNFWHKFYIIKSSNYKNNYNWENSYKMTF